jgi:hypothetical protein
MASRKMEIGICRICKQYKELSFEHIPPKVAFNKNTKYYLIPNTEILTSKNFLEYKPSGKIKQGGIGCYCLCQECNSFLGRTYVPEFSALVNIGKDIVNKYKMNFIHFTAYKQFPLKILKQIISMFVCLNEPWYTEEYPELLNFIKNPNENILPEKYRVYIYLNNEGQIRNWGWTMSNIDGIFGELTFPPFGYILQINNEKPIRKLTEITNFKSYALNEQKDIEFTLFKHPTYSPIPLDFRTIKEINKNQM